MPGGGFDHSVISRSGQKIIVYPTYPQSEIREGDIALIKLNQSYELEKDYFLRTICLPDKEELDKMVGQPCVVSGWGRTDPETTSDVMYKADQSIIKQETCGQFEKDWLSDLKLCSDSYVRHAGTCIGDSGGPLQCQKSGRWFLYGVVSYGQTACADDWPGIFARVSEMSEWVWKTIKVN